MPKANSLSRERCYGNARQIEEEFARCGVRINPSSDIGMFIREMQWLAERVDKPKVSLKAKEQKMFVNALLIADQAENIAATFARLAETEIPNTKLRMLQKRLDRLNKKGDPKARDILFELEVAGRLAQYPQWHVSFEEPDIIITWPDSCIGLACKRVKSAMQLSKRIREAADQGVRSGFPFFIILDVEPLTTQGKFLPAHSENDLYQECDQRLGQRERECCKYAKSAFEKRAGGLILCSKFVGLIGSAPGEVDEVRWCVRHKGIPNFAVSDAASALTTLIAVMEQRLHVQ